MRFVGDPTNHRIIGSMQGSWDLKISVAVISTVGIPVEEALADIEIFEGKYSL